MSLDMSIDDEETIKIKPKRRVKRVPSISGGSSFFEIPESHATATKIHSSLNHLTRLNIMKRRAQENSALFAEERHNVLNQLFPSRVLNQMETSPANHNMKGSFSMGPLLPRGRINTEDMVDENSHQLRHKSSFRSLINSTQRWNSRWEPIHPHGRFRNGWDVMTLVFVIWVIIYVPFMVAFGVDVDLSVIEWHHIISFMVDAFFMIDIVLNFNTGVEINGRVVMDRWVIAKDYAQSWLLIDVISGVPMDLVILATGDTSSSNSQFASIAKMGRMMRMFKLVRLFRIARVMRVVSRIENRVSTQEAVRTLYKFFAIVLVYCHLFSCGFYAVGVEYNGKEEWASGVPSNSSTFAKYIACFYWTIMTTTTIGYGDVKCNGTAQRLFGMLAMVIGALLFGYGVSNVVNIVEELRSEERKFREQMDKFNVYMRANNMPLPLQDSIREYLKNVKRVQSERLSMEQEIELISQVSYGIKEDIAEKVSAELIKAMPFFECEDPMVIMELSFNMERSFMGPDEEVIRFGDIGEEMYFILDGKVEVVLNTRGREEKKSVANLEKGDFFGEMALLQPNHVRTATVKTVTFCEFRCLTAELFRILSFNYPQFGRSLKSIVGARKKQHQEAGGRGVHRPMTKSSSFNLSRDDEPKIIVSSSFSIDKEPDDMKTPSKEAAEVSPPSRAESRVPGEPSETQLMQSIKAKMLEMSEMQKATINQIRAF